MSEGTLELELVTPDSVFEREGVRSLEVLSELGPLTILVDHAPMVCIIHAGEMRLALRDADAAEGVTRTEIWQVGEGTLQVAGGRVEVLTRAATEPQ